MRTGRTYVVHPRQAGRSALQAKATAEMFTADELVGMHSEILAARLRATNRIERDVRDAALRVFEAAIAERAVVADAP